MQAQDRGREHSLWENLILKETVDDFSSCGLKVYTLIHTNTPNLLYMSIINMSGQYRPSVSSVRPLYVCLPPPPSPHRGCKTIISGSTRTATKNMVSKTPPLFPPSLPPSLPPTPLPLPINSHYGKNSGR